ncbi:MAG: DNA gyrase/topoisomerase IV subunit A [Verrucomicrobiota bacterium]
MYSDWFIDYASYVILERAVPHLNDGLKPVQRRILHSMREMEDGRFNKVANVIGTSMKYHPHGDSAIGDAMVQLGQKQLLIETQGNWGNILTGDSAAAARYIEARLTKFALDVAFNAKTTEWAISYDGRNKEPVTLPMKFPLLLAQGAEGIAVGLACKILPHNFIELLEGCIEALRKKPTNILPDFPTGGLMDATEYNEGLRGGKVRVRARIEKDKKSKKLLRIVEIPHGTTTLGLQNSIAQASEKGKIKISKVEDITAEKVEILVHLPPGIDADQTINALYAFTDCEVSISPNACVIEDNKPRFLSVNELLKRSAFHSKDLLQWELEIRLNELEEKWHFSSLEKIFIEKRIYRRIEECTTWEAVISEIWKGLKPYLKKLRREVTEEDIVRLTEIKIKRISKYDSFKADELLKGIEKEIAEVKHNLKNLTRYAVAHFKRLIKTYGKGRERKTKVTTFGKVEAQKVAAATETLFLDAKEGFLGWGLKRGGGEAIGKCSRMDDVIAFTRDGFMQVSRVSEKGFFGKGIMHAALFNREKPLYGSMVYRDGKSGNVMVKRFEIKGVTRDKQYNLTKGTPGSRILFLAIQETDKAPPHVIVHMKPGQRLRYTEIDLDFKEYLVKSRGSMGNILTKHTVSKITKA